MRAVAVLLALAASAFAYKVDQPNALQGWTNSGSQLVVWERVSTDPANFTIILTNVDRALLPQDQILMAQQDGTGQTQVSVGPPSGGWPSGPHFRVNLVKDVNEPNTILAQSSEFTIGPSSSSGSALSTIRSTPTAVSPGATTTVPPSPSSSDTGNTSPPGSNGATVVKAGTGLLAILAAVNYLAV